MNCSFTVTSKQTSLIKLYTLFSYFITELKANKGTKVSCFKIYFFIIIYTEDDDNSNSIRDYRRFPKLQNFPDRNRSFQLFHCGLKQNSTKAEDSSRLNPTNCPNTCLQNLSPIPDPNIYPQIPVSNTCPNTCLQYLSPIPVSIAFTSCLSSLSSVPFQQQFQFPVVTAFPHLLHLSEIPIICSCHLSPLPFPQYLNSPWPVFCLLIHIPAFCT